MLGWGLQIYISAFPPSPSCDESHADTSVRITIPVLSSVLRTKRIIAPTAQSGCED